jgi:tRNA(adenine34) deaminase
MTDTDPNIEDSDARWMQLALDLAAAGARRGEVPVGALVVLDGRVIGEGFNRPITDRDPTAHAEIVALRAAARALDNYRLTGATLYVTVEPCTMCAGALVHARIARLVYGCPEPRSGAVATTANVLDNPGHNHRVAVTGGVLAAECGARLRAFFADRRSGERRTRQADSIGEAGSAQNNRGEVAEP